MRSLYEYTIALVYEWALPLAIGIVVWAIAIPTLWILHP